MLIADVVWPSLFLESRMATWWAISIGIIIEFFFVWKYFSLSAGLAALATIVMNLVSSIAGLFLIPASGFAYEFLIGQFVNRLMKVGTFNILTWIISVLLAILLNAIIESLVLKYGFKSIINLRRFLILGCANTVSVIVAYISLLVMPLNL